jgi:hypothetical protein
MSMGKIVISLVVLLLLAGSVVGVWYVTHPATAPDITDTDNTDDGITIPSPHIPGSEDAGKISGYPQLFAVLKATTLPFASVTSEAGEAGSVYALYRADIDTYKKSSKATTVPLDIALADLNGDHIKDAVVYENLGGFCGSGGCPIDVYIKQDEEWVGVLNTIGGKTIGISTAKNNSFLDLYISVAGTFTYQSEVVRFSWNDHEYQEVATVAIWDGSAFLR